MSEMILLDTNVLYALSGVDSRSDIDLELLKSFLKDKDVCVSNVTIFEILNNNLHSNQLSFIVYKTSKNCKSFSVINIYSKEGERFERINRNIGFKGLIRNREEVKEAIIVFYSVFYSNLFTSGCLSYFVLTVFLQSIAIDNISDDEYYNSFSYCYTNLNDKINLFLERLYSTLISENCFTEKERNRCFKQLLNNLLYYFQPAINDLDNTFEQDKFSYKRMFLKLNSLIKKADMDVIYNKKVHLEFDDVSPFSAIKRFEIEGNEKEGMELIINRVVDIFAKERNDVKLNPLFESLFNNYLKEFLIKGNKATNNDILDSMIADCLYYTAYINSIILFDNKFKSKIEKVFNGVKIYSQKDFVKQ